MRAVLGAWLLLALAGGCASKSKQPSAPAPAHEAPPAADAVPSASAAPEAAAGPGQAEAPGSDTAVLDERCRTWLSELTSESADQRERAALALFRRCDRGALRVQPQAAELLRTSVELGNGSAAALLLLGSFGDEASRKLLQAARTGTKGLKLEAWTAPVPPAVPATVALAQQGAPGARQELADAIAAPSLGTREFMLSVLAVIEDRSALRGLLAYLHDETEIAAGVPQGATPRRRLCDLALDALVERLGLHPSFPLRPASRYQPAELRELEQAAAAALAG